MALAESEIKLLERSAGLATRLDLPRTGGVWFFADARPFTLREKIEKFEQLTSMLPWISPSDIELRSPENRSNPEKVRKSTSFAEVSQWLLRPGHTVVLKLDFLGLNLAANATGMPMVYEKTLAAWLSFTQGGVALVGIGTLMALDRTTALHRARKHASRHSPEVHALGIPTPAMLRLLKFHEKRIEEILAVFCDNYSYLGNEGSDLLPPVTQQAPAPAHFRDATAPRLQLSVRGGVITLLTCGPKDEAFDEDALKRFVHHSFGNFEPNDFRPTTYLEFSAILEKFGGPGILDQVPVKQPELARWRILESDDGEIYFICVGQGAAQMFCLQPQHPREDVKVNATADDEETTSQATC